MDTANRSLTPRELEALRLASNGMQSPEAAKVLGLQAARSVRCLWVRAAEKLGADNTTQACCMAIRRGLIQ